MPSFPLTPKIKQKEWTIIRIIQRTIQQLSKYTFPKTKLLITKQNITTTTETITLTETKKPGQHSHITAKSWQDCQSL